MKKILAPLFMLPLLFACGKKSSSSSGSGTEDIGELLRQQQEAIRLLPRGHLTISTTTGITHDWSLNTELSKWVWKERAEHSQEKEIILRKDNDLTYTLLEERDLITRNVYRRVALERESFAEMEEILQIPGIRVVDRVLFVPFDFSVESDFTTPEGGTAILAMNGHVEAQVNLKAPGCDIIAKTTGIHTMTQNGATETLPATTSTAVTVCGGVLSNAELKALDLSSVTFCDETIETEEDNCQYNTNMSFLTSDL